MAIRRKILEPTIGEKVKPMRDLEDLRRELVSRKYSPKTIKVYIHYNEDLLRFAKKSSVDVVDYGDILKKNFAYEIKRPEKDKKLPAISSGGEISRLLSSVANVKHKAILMLAYSAGLRVGEVVRLNIEDIDLRGN